jgi:hypothetical protein
LRGFFVCSISASYDPALRGTSSISFRWLKLNTVLAVYYATIFRYLLSSQK